MPMIYDPSMRYWNVSNKNVVDLILDEVQKKGENEAILSQPQSCRSYGSISQVTPFPINGVIGWSWELR